MADLEARSRDTTPAPSPPTRSPEKVSGSSSPAAAAAAEPEVAEGARCGEAGVLEQSIGRESAADTLEEEHEETAGMWSSNLACGAVRCCRMVCLLS